MSNILFADDVVGGMIVECSECGINFCIEYLNPDGTHKENERQCNRSHVHYVNGVCCPGCGVTLKHPENVDW